MCRAAFATEAMMGVAVQLYAVPLAESAGVANVKTITITGPATADGVLTFHVSGRPFQVGVRNGDVQNTIAAAISNTLKANTENLPVAVSVATNIVTLTHNTKGVNGIDVKVTNETSVAGVTVAIANTVVGTQVTDHQPALDALSAVPMDAIAFANHAAADITEINTDILSRWSYSEKRWRWYFLGEPGTIGTATSLASSANHQAVLIASMENCQNTAGEMATALAVAAMARAQLQPNANFDGVRLPLYPPILASDIYTPTEVETAIAAGLTPLFADFDPFTGKAADGTSKIVRMITTKTTNNSLPFAVLRDFAVARTGVALAIQIDIAYNDRFGTGASFTGALLTEDMVSSAAGGTGQGQVRDMLESVLRNAETANWIRNVDSLLPQLIVERDLQVSGRVNVDLPYLEVVGMHQLAVIHRVQI
jgi:phage tail sheath gpL-like